MSLRTTSIYLALLLLAPTTAVRAGSSEDAAARPDFVRDVMPVLVKSGCNGGKCHGSFQGRGGFQLSLFGLDAEFDYSALVRESRQRRVSPAAPDRSLILRKPLAEVPHGGGQRFQPGSESYRILRSWIANGAPAAADFELHVADIEVSPRDVTLNPDEHVALQIHARWSDGVQRDVTRWALYEARDEQCAAVTDAGQIEARSPGRTTVTVSFLGQVRAVNVTVPYARPADPLVFEPYNYIDEHVAAEWEKVGLRPVESAGDEEFVRRAYLDVIGTLPTPEEIRSFVADPATDKRAQLIDTLLKRPEYVDYWSYRWADLLRVHRRYVGDKGMWSFWNWVRRAVRENWPVDRITRELIVSKGSLFSNGATAYYFVDEDPAQLGETTAQLFLGIRMQCAECHHHPYETWSQADYYGLANFFTRIEIKDNGDGARYGGTKLLRPVTTPNRERRVSMNMEPMLFGQVVDPTEAGDVRTVLADRITDPENPWFARNFVNRFWSYLMGRGLVEPVDDLRATNPPTHPELMDALAADFIDSGCDVKQLIRTICTSHVYQLASRVEADVDRDGVFYTHRRYHRLPAPVLLDAVNFAVGATEEFNGLPRGTRAIALPDPGIQSYFLEAFGRSPRSSPCECATTSKPDLIQALHLMNSEAIQKKLAAPGGRIQTLLKQETPDAEAIEQLFLVTWSRPSTEEEQQAALTFVTQADTRQEGYEDLLWALLNSTSFAFAH
ncbi:MAG: DUF1553 domain-containing protein [Planctomycetota bacterium]|nr:MAG: DUF1553 domain-containing protein [Planctomycetota bacterium]REJ94893.1 MAG: DUF1553 domain-containing protein [Planctomycetota bacterium]REK27285.1 MAG: DUF1553 domain-containing protein [Planctomycetota bacterium]REK36694.1 MAG: DUF1553 domain-containing protein [Planctomycetota bacterium]